MKKTISLFLATVVAAVLPLTCSAETISNSNFIGTYYNKTNSRSYIDVQSKKCYAIIVYDPIDQIYIKGSTNNYTIKVDTKYNKYKFSATFTKYVHVNSSGATIGVENQELNLVGDYSYISKSKPKIITIGSDKYVC